MKKILYLILGLVLACGLHGQVAVAGHAASVGSVNAAPVSPGDVVGPASSTDNAFARFSGTTGKLLQDSPDLTYVSPTLSVPDAFVVSSAGSIGLTAGGAAKNVVISPSTTGLILGQFNTSVTGPGINGFHLMGKDATNIGYSMDGYGVTPFFISRRANGTAAVPTATAANDYLLQVVGRGYGTSFTGSRSIIGMRSSELWTATANGTQMEFTVTPNTTTSGIVSLFLENSGRVSVQPSTSTLSAWGTTGVSLNVAAATKTDSSSSGTVATAVANSFAVPTFAASSATTFTDFANVYIAGAPTRGTNVTAGNPWAEWIAAGNVNWGGIFGKYNGLTTAGLGVPTIVAQANITAQSAAATITSYANPATDADFEISCQLNVSAATSLSAPFQCTYTDVNNVAKTLTFAVQDVDGTGGTFLVNGVMVAAAAKTFMTPVVHIRVKASTTITLKTGTGTYTGVTYSASGIIKKTD